eukprot:SM000114S24168  [mRNA]  locus=s114:296090:298708:- [translate_table: standard]
MGARRSIVRAGRSRCRTRAVREANAAADAASGGAVSGVQARLLATAPGEAAEQDLYAVLGVPRGCDAAAIKRAFYGRAKRLHPDARPRGGPGPAAAGAGSPQPGSGADDTELFIRLAAAYEVLSEPRRRAIYDAQASPARSQSSSSASAAPSSSYHHNAGEASISQEWDTGGSDVAEWLRYYRVLVTRAVHTTAIPGAPGRRDLRASIEDRVHGELHAALKRAYFGPPLEVGLELGLPACFEAEERSHISVPDVLQLVSGRQLLGAVREYHRVGIESCGTAAQTLVTAQDPGSSSLLETVEEGGAGTAPEKRLEGVEERCAGQEWSRRGEPRAAGGAACSVQATQDNSQRREAAFAALELELHGKIVAVATRESLSSAQLREGSHTLEHPVSQNEEEELLQHLGGEEAVDCVSVFGTGGAELPGRPLLLGRIWGLGSTVNGARSCSIFSAQGRRTHTVMHHQLPMASQMSRVHNEGACRCGTCSGMSYGVHASLVFVEPDGHIWFLPGTGCLSQGVEGMTKGDGILRCLTAVLRYLLQASISFAVLCWLHPAVYILSAAYNTLDMEAQKRARISSNSISRYWSRFVAGIEDKLIQSRTRAGR